jgi:FkbM family methyltransferase
MARTIVDRLKMTKRYFNTLSEKDGVRSIKPTEDFVPVKVIETAHGKIGLYCAGRICLYRADTFFTKEPETLEWIDGFTGECVLWDIGANVGLYSLYAALRPTVKVLAFEPSAFNYFILMKNIDINGLDQKLSGFCLAFNDATELACLTMNYLEVGDSCHGLVNFADRVNAGTTALQQGVLMYTIDEFVRKFNPPFPTHIKIDVDGVEGGIIKGAKQTLADKRLTSILIEIDEDNPGDKEIVAVLEASGFVTQSRRHAPQFEGSPYFNYVFTRP